MKAQAWVRIQRLTRYVNIYEKAGWNSSSGPTRDLVAQAEGLPVVIMICWVVIRLFDDLLVFPPAMVLQQLHSDAEVVGERSYLPSWLCPQAGPSCISGEVAITASATCSRTAISHSMLGGKADCLEFSSLFPQCIEAGTDTDMYLSIWVFPYRHKYIFLKFHVQSIDL